MESVLNGKSIHKYILCMCEPIEWIKSFQLVSHTWRDASRSDELWLHIRDILLDNIPSLQHFIQLPNIYYRMRYLASCSNPVEYLTDLNICRDIGIINIDPSLRDQITIDLITDGNAQNITLLYRGTSNAEFIVRTNLTVIRNVTRFVEPLVQLILYGRVKNWENTMLWGNTIMNIMFVAEIAKRRKRVRIC